MNSTSGPQSAAQDAYAGAPDMEAEGTALVALAAALSSGARSAAAVRPLAVRKAAWLDRAALAAPADTRAVLLADRAARELLAHDRAFGPAPMPADFADPRAYVRRAYAAHLADA